MDILKNFGVDPILLTAQIVNFLIIFWLLKRYAYKPILAMLDKRKKLVAQGIEDAKKSEELLQKTQENERDILKKAHVQAQELLLDAQKQAQAVVQTAETHAQERVAKILEEGQKELLEQTEEAQKQLSQHTARLAVQLLEKTLPAILDTKTQKQVVSKVNKKLNA